MCLGTAWFANALSAKNAGAENIYDYGIRCLRFKQEAFYHAGIHKVEPHTTYYEPNPFVHQYDLTVFIWLNYYKILQDEIKLLKALHEKKPFEGHASKAESLMMDRTLYGITREDFLFAAAEMRWPTLELADGSLHGDFIRDPWSERRARALSNERLKYNFSFGGGGQGKTHVYIAFFLMIFDYYMFTSRGARFMISTVNEDKLEGVSWSRLSTLHANTETEISLTAGRGKLAGGFTLMRHGTKDKGGSIKGILINDAMNNQKIIDKLTGSHGHNFIGYLMDEMQSTPDAPILASSNFTLKCGDFRITGAGNYGENDDTLAKNIKPDQGWDNVNEETGEWISTTQNNQKAIVLHFNNNLSPGMTDEGKKKFPHLPNRTALESKYPTPSSRTMDNLSYRRFWVGFRVVEAGNNSVIHERLIKENLADRPVDLATVHHRFFTFDSAQAEIDRNLAIVYHEGTCKETKERVFGPVMGYPLEKSTESIKYYQESTKQLQKIIKDNHILSGAGIVDWTGRPAHAEMLHADGFQVHQLIYNKGIPDGTRRDKHTNRIERKIPLNVQLDWKDTPADQMYAHLVAKDCISLGAWALRQYVLAGRVRGIHPDFLKYVKSERSLEDELFNRKFKYRASSAYGSLFELEPKVDFKKQFGFSPDFLDNLFQAAYYMLMIRQLPLTPVAKNDEVRSDSDEDDLSDLQEHSKLWEEDMIL